MAQLLRAGRLLVCLAALLLTGCAGQDVAQDPTQAPFGRAHWERATRTFVKAYRAWVTREGSDPPAVRLDRVLDMTGRGLSVVPIENTIISEMAVADVPVITDKPGEIPPEVVFDLQVEVTEQILRSGGLQAEKSTIYFKLFEPTGRGLVVSEIHKEQLDRPVE